MDQTPGQNPLSHDITGAELAGDLLKGADEIATFIFGDRGSRRKVYYLSEHTRIPLFRLGSQLCARRSVLLRWIAGQENRLQEPTSRRGLVSTTEAVDLQRERT